MDETEDYLIEMGSSVKTALKNMGEDKTATITAYGEMSVLTREELVELDRTVKEAQELVETAWRKMGIINGLVLGNHRKSELDRLAAEKAIKEREALKELSDRKKTEDAGLLLTVEQTERIRTALKYRIEKDWTPEAFNKSINDSMIFLFCRFNSPEYLSFDEIEEQWIIWDEMKGDEALYPAVGDPADYNRE